MHDPIAFASGVAGLWTAVGIIGLAAAHQGWSSNLYTLASYTTPRGRVASVIGIDGAAGAVGGMLMAKYVGVILERIGFYLPIFLWASTAYLAAHLLIHILVPRLDRPATG